MVDVNKLLNTTLAGQTAKKLDAKDGTEDGKISGTVWNEFIDEIGVGKKISDNGSISVFNTMNSITTYAVKSGKSNANDLAKNWMEKLGEVQASAENAGAAAAGSAEDAAPAAEAAAKNEQPAEVSDAERKANIQKDYSSIRVTLQTPDSAGQKPDASKVNVIKKNKAGAKKVAQEIIAANNAFRDDKTAENVGKIRAAIAKINKDNVAYVLREIPNLAEVLNGVNFFGLGLDEEDIFKCVMKPLEEKLKGMGIKGSKFSPDDSWEKMGKDAATYSDKIRTADSKVIKSYNNKVKAYNNRVADMKQQNSQIKDAAKDVTLAANKLAQTANNHDLIQKIESGTGSDNSSWKKATLKDGTVITAFYNPDGTFHGLDVSSSGVNVYYDNDGQVYAQDKWYNTTQNRVKNIEALIDKIFK